MSLNSLPPSLTSPLAADELRTFLLREWVHSWNEVGVVDGVWAKLESHTARLEPLLQPRPETQTVSKRPQAEAAQAKEARKDAPAMPSIQSCSVVFVFPEGSESLNTSTHALLCRMVSAMGLPADAVALCTAAGLVECSLLSAWPEGLCAATQARVYVGLGSEACVPLGASWQPGVWQRVATSHGEVDFLATHALDSILAQPQLKRSVWENLQQVMQKLSS